MVICNRTICIAIECPKLINVLPYQMIICMKNVCSILVDLNSFNFFCKNIASNMVSFFNYKTFLSLCSSFMRKNCPKQSGSYYQIIICITHLSVPFQLLSAYKYNFFIFIYIF